MFGRRWRQWRDLFGVLLCLLAAHTSLDHTLMAAGLGPTAAQVLHVEPAPTPGAAVMMHARHASDPTCDRTPPAQTWPGHRGANCCPPCQPGVPALLHTQEPPKRPLATRATRLRAAASHDRPAARTHADARAPPELAPRA